MFALQCYVGQYDCAVLRMTASVCVCGVTMQLSEMATELEDQRELATSRLTELEKLQQDHQEAVKQIETLKMDVRELFMLSFLSIQETH